VTRAVGSLAAALGGIDGLVFTAGIGEHAAPVRERVCRGLAWLGLEFDEAANAAGGPRISRESSRVSAWVVPTDEERMIAMHVKELLGL
jgi:acetate kinase